MVTLWLLSRFVLYFVCGIAVQVVTYVVTGWDVVHVSWGWLYLAVVTLVLAHLATLCVKVERVSDDREA